jgi:hypothetical protein
MKNNVSFSGIFEAFKESSKWILFTVAVLILFSTVTIFISNLIFSIINVCTLNICNLIGYYPIILFFVFFVELLIIYLGYRFILLRNTKIIFETVNSIEQQHSILINNRELNQIIYEYKLSAHYNNKSEMFGLKLNQELVEFLQTIDKDFKYHNPYSPSGHAKNFDQVLRILDKLDMTTISDKLPQFMESLIINIHNIDNDIKHQYLLEPTQGFVWWTRPVNIIYKDTIDKLFDGKNFKITIKYRGEKGYNLKIWTK